ncbi:hypothetical protein IV102_06735 [bacterium]|nr:hypothetical protein [bacterium]
MKGWLCWWLLLACGWAESFNPQQDLPRLGVGIQAGLIRVLGADRQTVLYSKGIDEPASARWDEDSRRQLFGALELDPRSVDRVSAYLMKNYATLPHREAIALLGVLFGSPELSRNSRPQVELFLVTAMNTDRQVEARRQAILALAVAPLLSDFAVDRVVGKFERCDNLWELFPMQQFFEYQAAQLRSRKSFARLGERLSKVNSLYTPAILQSLEGPP